MARKPKPNGKFYKVLRVGDVIFQFQEAQLGDGSIGKGECIYYTLSESMVVSFHLVNLSGSRFSAHINGRTVGEYLALNFERDEVTKNPGRLTFLTIEFRKPLLDIGYITLADIQVDSSINAWLCLEYHLTEPVAYSL